VSVLDAPATLEIALAGTAVDDALMAELASATIEQRLNAPASCELTFNDPLGRAAQLCKLGVPVAVRAGIEHQTIFDGSFARIELVVRGDLARTLRVIAYDALDSLRRGTPVRVHSDVTFVGLARELTRSLGIDVDATPYGTVQPHVVQHRRSDFDLLLESAERAGAYFRLVDGTLRTYPIAASGSAKALEIGRDVRELTVTLSDADAAAAVDVSGWDPHRGRAFHGTAARTAGGNADVKLTNVIVRSDGQADAVARSQIERRAANGATLHLVAEGNPALAPGDCIRLNDVPDGYAGPFRITLARHRFGPSLGYAVELSSALPAPHPPRQNASATLGVVADVRDPDAFGRVKVRYPAMHDAESDWLQVLAAGAGGKKGLVALPAVDDLVLVLVVDDDPANAVVLGALYGSGGMPGERPEAFKGYALYSPGGHTIRLDDDGALTLSTPAGTSIELGRDEMRLHSQTDLTIEAPGKTITIAATAVEVKQR
jgi:uncharacterized protein involved in type VI secretion and phage assembly